MRSLVVVLPYGPDPDWVRNVVAAGTARVHHDGRVIDVERPRVVPIDHVAERLDDGQALVRRLFGIREALVLPVADG